MFNAVWRHVLGEKDYVDQIDIALGKCNLVTLHLDLSTVVLFLVLVRQSYYELTDFSL